MLECTPTWALYAPIARPVSPSEEKLLKFHGRAADSARAMLAASGVVLLVLMAVALIDGASVLVRPLRAHKRI
jgi:hypothetical protein